MIREIIERVVSVKGPPARVAATTDRREALAGAGERLKTPTILVRPGRRGAKGDDVE